MLESTLIELAKLFLSLSDKTRLRLLALMAGGEVPVGFLADKLGESQPKISRHLAYLRNSGLVSTRRDGKWIYYSLENQTDVAVNRVLDATLRSVLADDFDRNTLTNSPHDGDAYRSYDGDAGISSETYMNAWAPADIDIFLL